MALLDVSEIFDDPNLTDTLTCIRETRVAGDDGLVDEFETNTTETDFIGIVQDPGPGDPWVSSVGGTYVQGNMIVYTQFRLTAGDAENDIAADRVRFNGAEYSVKAISDWTNFGQGYLKVLLLAQSLNP